MRITARQGCQRRKEHPAGRPQKGRIAQTKNKVGPGGPERNARGDRVRLPFRKRWSQNRESPILNPSYRVGGGRTSIRPSPQGEAFGGRRDVGIAPYALPTGAEASGGGVSLPLGGEGGRAERGRMRWNRTRGCGGESQWELRACCRRRRRSSRRRRPAFRTSGSI